MRGKVPATLSDEAGRERGREGGKERREGGERERARGGEEGWGVCVCACVCLCECGAGGAGAALAAGAAAAGSRCEHCRLQAAASGPEGLGGLPEGPRAAPAAAPPAHLHFLNEPLDGRQRRQPPGPAATLAAAEPRRPRGTGDGEVPAAGAAPVAARGTFTRRRVRARAGLWGREGAAGAVPSPARSRRSRAGSPVPGRAPLPPPPALPPPTALPGVRHRRELLAINNNKPNLHLPLPLRKQLIMH